MASDNQGGGTAAHHAGVQPGGFLLELSPDWLILRASENVHRFLGEYHVRLIGEPLSDFTMAQPLHDLRNSLSRQRSRNGIARVYRVRLIDEPKYFDFAFQQLDSRILLEGVPSSDDSFGGALGAISRLIEGLDSGDGQPRLDGAARRMRALTGFDRVMLSLDAGNGPQRAESSRGSFAPASADLDRARLPEIVADTSCQPVQLFPRAADDSAAGEALMRVPDPQQLAELQARDVRSILNVPIFRDGERIGGFHCENRAVLTPSFELHAAAELFAQIFAMRLD